MESSGNTHRGHQAPWPSVEAGGGGREPGGAGGTSLMVVLEPNVMKQGHLGAPGQTVILRAHAGIISRWLEGSPSEA